VAEWCVEDFIGVTTSTALLASAANLSKWVINVANAVSYGRIAATYLTYLERNEEEDYRIRDELRHSAARGPR
jgi:hypothetical protein